MTQHPTDRIPPSATAVLVCSPPLSAVDTCARLSGRGDRVLLVGYGGVDADTRRNRLADEYEIPPTVRQIDVGTDVDPGDLTGLGIVIAEALSPGTEVCFDSLTALLQYVDRKRAVRFVHSVVERCADSSATMHVHLDPTVTDERTVAATATLMDAVVVVESDSVRLRPEFQKD